MRESVSVFSRTKSSSASITKQYSFDISCSTTSEGSKLAKSVTTVRERKDIR